MADLIDRLSGLDQTRPKISIHQFFGGMRGYVSGVISASEIVQDWDLQGAELTQAVAIRNEIDARPSASAKVLYVLRCEAVAFLLENSDDTIYHTDPLTIDKARVAVDLGI